MLRSGSSIADFVYDCLREKEEEWVSKERMYGEYVRYARTRGLSVATIHTLGRKLSKYAPYISEGKPLDPITKKQITAWMNVAILPAEEGVPKENIIDIIDFSKPYESKK